MKYDAFISYRRENGFLMAQVIHDRLKERGISCFLDLEEDRSGKFDENLLRAIESAPNFILILPKNALNRCKNEDDWVRREIIAALNNKKLIIPVMYDGFKWPRKWPEGIPEEIKQLRYQQAVSMSQEYLSAMIDKIVSYMTGLPDVPRLPHSNPATNGAPEASLDFFSVIKDRLPDIEYVCMAFHSGAEWRRDPGKVTLLQHILDHKIPLKVIVNGAKTADILCKHMRQPLKKYVGIDNCVEEWMELQDISPDSIQVRVCDIPLIHRIYMVRMKDGTGMINIKYYTYGNYTPAKDFRMCFSSDQAEFALYSDEFFYLWKISDNR